MLVLTPAYDICPQGRSGNEASQAMLISGDNRMSQISASLEAAHLFQLSNEEAATIIEKQMIGIGDHWASICEAAELTKTDRNLFWGRQFLNPFAFADLGPEASHLRELSDKIRSSGGALNN